MSDIPNLPLAGIVVLDFGQVFQGPYATLLCEMARRADVCLRYPPSSLGMKKISQPSRMGWK